LGVILSQKVGGLKSLKALEFKGGGRAYSSLIEFTPMRVATYTNRVNRIKINDGVL